MKTWRELLDELDCLRAEMELKLADDNRLSQAKKTEKTSVDGKLIGVAVGFLLRALEDKGFITCDEVMTIMSGGSICAKPMDMRGE